MKAKFAKLIDVKSIVTILLTVVFSIMTAAGKVTSEQFITIFTVVISFYFGTQAGKKDSTDNNGENRQKNKKNDKGEEFNDS